MDIESANQQNAYLLDIEKMNKNKNVILYASVMVQFLLMLATLPVANIVVGIRYYHSVLSCGTSLISIPQWLIIIGGAEAGLILYHALILLSLHETCKNFYKFLVKLFLVPTLMCLLFCFAWLAVGSIWFWKNCDSTGSESVNNMMWCSLILGYIWSSGMTLIFRNVNVN